MRFNVRQATWVFAISAALLGTPGFAHGQQPQDDHGRAQGDGRDNVQNDRQGDQQGDRRDNVQNDRQGNQQGYQRDNNQYDRHARNGAPEGGYMQSCQDIRTVGTTLQASCQKKNGKWKQASLRNFNQCTNQIENNNGKLVCSR